MITYRPTQIYSRIKANGDHSSCRGMTFAELLVAMAIFVVVMVAVTTFYVNILNYQSTVSGSYQTAQSAQIILKTMLQELREVEPAANGAYPLVLAGSTTITFFCDPDNDGTAEELSYTLIGKTIYQVVIQPSGSPAVYNSANQSTTTIFTNVVNGTSTPVFQYFDTNYNGTSTPLVQPVTTTAVRLVRVNVTLDFDPTHSPAPTTYTIQASFRNLKTNL